LDFDAKRSGSGTREWSEHSVNIQVGCSNGCLYCYAADTAAKLHGGWCERSDWTLERLSKAAAMTSYPKKEGVVMMPTTHDITPFNLEAFIRVALLVLAKGNQMLIVSKPRLICIRPLLEALDPFKSQIMFRFTIGTMDEKLLSFWEPGAPTAAERVECLSLATLAGFRTSVSIEPIVGGEWDAISVVDAVGSLVTDSIWIGKMNKLASRVDVSEPVVAAAVQAVEDGQSDEAILRLHWLFQDVPYIRWKKSIEDVVAASKK
jgi:DNA repair photolyase